MNQFPATERIKKIRSQYLQTPMQRKKYPGGLYGNHPGTIHWLRGYLEEREAVTSLKRRSLAQKHELENSKVIINDDELLVGQPDFFMTEEEREEFATLYKMFRMAPCVNDDGRNDHTALDYRKLLKVGGEGLIAEIKAELA